MIWVLYNVETGGLLQISEEPLQANYPLAVKAFGSAMPNLALVEWDSSTIEFRAKAGERNISGVQYLRRFTQAERIAIRNAAKQSPELDDYLKLLDATIAQGGVIDLNDPDNIDACNLLESLGLIASGRAAEVLA